MARPRIFVSSTYYDLKHIRSSLDNFIETLGYDSILFEKGDIAFSPDIALDESCYKEIESANVFVLIIGGRYGSAASSEEKKPQRNMFEQYNSVTRREYEAALSRDIPTYILIEQNVYSEYQTFLRNATNDTIQYAHVDSTNIFKLIQEILNKPRNNPIRTFERFSDIEIWLREQWAGLFRELLQRMSSQSQIAALSSQVESLSAINSTLQKYLEAMVSKALPEDGKKIIEHERKRLVEFEQLELLKQNRFYNGALKSLGVSIAQFRDALLFTTNYKEFTERLAKIMKDKQISNRIMSYNNEEIPMRDLNDGRRLLDLEPYKINALEGQKSK